MKRNSTLIAVLLATVLAATALAAQAPKVSEKKDVAIFALGYYGLAIPLETLGSIDIEIQKVFVDLGRFNKNTDLAQRRFAELLPLLAELAELQNAVLRLARELRKTQRRFNALSKIFIPSYRETITYISGTLEERERESLTILKIIRDRLAQPSEVTTGS